MELFFSKDSERTYSTTVKREDGVTLKIKGPDRPLRIPHDLAHFVVENELKLKFGFWGKVAAGVVFPGMEVLAGRRKPHAADRAKAVQAQAGQQGIQAEVLVDVMIKIAENNLPMKAAQKLLKESWKPSKSARETFTAEEITMASRRLKEAESQWMALPVGGTMKFDWHSQSLHKMR
jgi:hypothetical protein